jgi:hypothetical protein
MSDNKDDKLFNEFIETLSHTGFKNVERHHALLLKLEARTAASNQCASQ